MKAWLIKIIPKPCLRRWHIWRNGRFTVLKWETEGLFADEIYERLHAEFLAAPDGDVVEVGGASGAGTISVALALKEGRKNGKIVVVEKFEGGTREKYGGHEVNLQRFWGFIERYGVKSYVRLWDGFLTEENVPQVRALVQTPVLAGLVMDADGCIHRDLNAFWDLLTPETRIFIDDYHPTHSGKHRLTYELTNFLVAEGFLKKLDQIEITVIARRASFDGRPFPIERCRVIYDEVDPDGERARAGHR